ncbi:NAD(P)-dependent oxidoreductase [Bacillus sp. SRB_331]|uniref:NAD-dependent epimerase/dehydratase family protein n=1 Tax=Bacillus sp. SRB_331 TaxID=1969379 RepID=UPI000DC3AD3E|nr:NAD-dependent epimerase/dehydratase family protein [Bacillus sp. SRB_331]RAN76611.1 UDP-glucose 4-epimerase [Bacillus sp. SRB_331]
MKVLITGAAGFIGSNLAHQIYKKNWEMILIDNLSYGKEENLKFSDCDLRGKLIKMDVRDKERIEELIQKERFECIFHIAGVAPLPECQSDPAHAIDVNVIGLVNILEAARKFGVRKIIFASTTAIYENDTVFPSQEEGFKLPTLIYPNTKYVAERFCQSYCDTYGMNVSCIRFANVYGPHIDCLRKQPPFVGYMIRELYFNRIPHFYSNGKQKRDYIFVDDLMDLMFLTINSEGFECINAASNKSYSVNEMFEIAKKIMGKTDIKPVYLEPKKYWDKYPELYQGAYMISNDILYNEVNKYTQCSNEYARQAYGWKPKVSMAEGLSKTIIYMKDQLNLLYGN